MMSSRFSALPIREKHTTFSTIVLERKRQTMRGSIVGNIDIRCAGDSREGVAC